MEIIFFGEFLFLLFFIHVINDVFRFNVIQNDWIFYDKCIIKIIRNSQNSNFLVSKK